jgi:methylthioribose-1-phosphate isomerase
VALQVQYYYHYYETKMAAIGLTSIRISGDFKIEIVNQLLLPHTTEFIEIDSIEKAHDAIKSMKVIFA